MAKARSKLGILWMAGGTALLGAGGWFYYTNHVRDALPQLGVVDIQDDSREAAKVERFKGKIEVRSAQPEDETPGRTPAQAPIWSTVGTGQSIRLGSFIQASAQSSVELATAGHWYMGLDGDGAMILRDARRNAENTSHLLSVFLKKGMFRAKAASGDHKGYVMEIVTAAAKVRVFEGEFGIEVNDQGHGRMWLLSGKAVALWNDGRRKELGLRGLENL